MTRNRGDLRTRLTVQPGQPGARHLTAIYGDRLVAVRYRYDAVRRMRIKTVELVVSEAPWDPPTGTKAPSAATPRLDRDPAVNCSTVKASTVEPTTVEPTTVKPMAVKPTTVKPTTVKPTMVNGSTVYRPTVNGSTNNESIVPTPESSQPSAGTGARSRWLSKSAPEPRRVISHVPRFGPRMPAAPHAPSHLGAPAPPRHPDRRADGGPPDPPSPEPRHPTPGIPASQVVAVALSEDRHIELRRRLFELGATWNRDEMVFEMTYAAAHALGLADHVRGPARDDARDNARDDARDNARYPARTHEAHDISQAEEPFSQQPRFPAQSPPSSVKEPSYAYF